MSVRNDEIELFLGADLFGRRVGQVAPGALLGGADLLALPLAVGPPFQNAEVVLLGDARLATTMADKLLQRGIYVIGFSFPVVPKGQARIRTQMSAGLTQQQLNHAVDAFSEVGRELKVIS